MGLILKSIDEPIENTTTVHTNNSVKENFDVRLEAIGDDIVRINTLIYHAGR